VGKGRRIACGSPRGVFEKVSARSRGYGCSGLMKHILVYRKEHSATILQDKERERELAAKKEIGGLAIGDKDKG